MHSPLAHYLKLQPSPQHCQRGTAQGIPRACLCIWTRIKSTDSHGHLVAICMSQVCVCQLQVEIELHAAPMPPSPYLSTNLDHIRRNGISGGCSWPSPQVFSGFSNSSISSLLRFCYWGGSRLGFWWGPPLKIERVTAKYKKDLTNGQSQPLWV